MNLLTDEEVQRLRAQGQEALTGKEMSLPRMDDTALRDFVMGYCDGHIWTNLDVRPEEIGSLFMPVILGALSIPEKVVEELKDKFPPNPGEEPNSPKKPEAATLPPLPEKPKEPEVVQIDLDHIARIRSSIEWQVMTEEAVDRYEMSIRDKNAALQEEYQQEIAKWVVACDLVEKKRKDIEDAHAKQIAEYDAQVAALKDKIKEWKLAKARHRAFSEGAIQQYTKDLGIIWEDTRKNTSSPMSCNGHPCFFSCHLMHRDDSERVLAAVNKELEHRKNFTI